MTLQSALAVLLSGHGAGHDLPIGTTLSGRGEDGLTDLPGLVANTVVLRTDTSGDPTFTELLARVRAADLDAFDHGDLPFERLVDDLAPERSLSRHPLFQVALIHQNAPERTRPFGPGTADVELVETRAAKFDLTFAVVEETGTDGLKAALNYRTALFDRPTVEALARRLTALLHRLCAYPDLPISHIPVLDGTEQRWVLDTSAGPTVPWPPGPSPTWCATRRPAPRRPRRCATAAGAGATESSTPRPTGSPDSSRTRTCDAATSWPSPCPGAPNSSSPSTPSSAPEPPICRWTRPCPRPASATCSATPTPPC